MFTFNNESKTVHMHHSTQCGETRRKTHVCLEGDFELQKNHVNFHFGSMISLFLYKILTHFPSVSPGEEVPAPRGATSAPSIKERISFRDNPVQLSGGWGGGKKRGKVYK